MSKHITSQFRIVDILSARCTTCNITPKGFNFISNLLYPQNKVSIKLSAMFDLPAKRISEFFQQFIPSLPSPGKLKLTEHAYPSMVQIHQPPGTINRK